MVKMLGLRLQKLSALLSSTNKSFSEKGLAPIFILFLLVLGVLGGTYLVQQRTNILPFAVDNDPYAKLPDLPPKILFQTAQNNCVDGSDPFSSAGGRIDGFKWSANCNALCQSAPDCEVNSSFPANKQAASRTCFPFKDGNRCIKLELTEAREGIISSQSQSGGSKLTASSRSCTIQSGENGCEIEFSWETDQTTNISLSTGTQLYSNLPSKGSQKISFVTNAQPQREITMTLRSGDQTLTSLKVTALDPKYGTTTEEDDQETDEEEDDEEEDEAQNALFQRCGFTKNDQGLPIYAIGLGQNPELQDPECQKLIDQQTQYFGNKMEKARQRAEELAKQNKLKYQQGVFVPDDGLSEEELEEAKKKADELNQTVAPAIKQAELAQDECKNKEGQEKANCLKNVQDPVQKVMDETQKAAARGTLDKLNQILDGKRPGGCVKADLNLTPHLEAKRLKARGVDASNPKGRRTFHRLLICAGKNKQDWKWRVLVGGVATGETDGGGTVNNSGTNDDDECGDKDCGNDAERLYGLYGTDESYDGPPQFGSGFPINRCVTLTGNTPEAIRKDLAIYIKAAETGESPTAPGGGPCRAPSAPDADESSGDSDEDSSDSDDDDSSDEDEEDGDSTSPGGSNPEKGSKQEGECSSDETCLKKNGPDSGAKCDLQTRKCYIPRSARR